MAITESCFEYGCIALSNCYIEYVVYKVNRQLSNSWKSYTHPPWKMSEIFRRPRMELG